MLKYIAMFVILIYVFIPTSSQASNSLTETFSCDTCDYNDAVLLARSLRIPLQCEWVNESDTSEISTDESYLQCPATRRILIVANPLSKVAFKFGVNVTNTATHWLDERVEVIDYSLSSQERDALEKFYDIDSAVRTAVANVQSISASSVQFNQATPQGKKTVAKSGQLSQPSDDPCSSSPLQFFTSLSAERDVLGTLKEQMSDAVGTQNWFDFTEDVDLLGGGLDISKDGFGVSINFSRNNVDSFVTYGSNTDNVLSFKVTYGGDIDENNGNRGLALAFELQKGASYVDGIPLSSLLANGQVNLMGTIMSNCTLEKLEEIAGPGGVTNTPQLADFNDFPIGPGMPVPICVKTIRATTCSTANNERTCTTSIIRSEGRC